ncbi:transcriptional regulator [Rhodobacter sp. ETT8]|uniref:Transcriptional regulator n=2 Tax=Pseudotabrizicola algicola TaxID=2709381 RepID=A0A6B3RRE0_9RHOB|nr:transcriptional regulator [Pseudotabrizicola algicola]
MSGDNQKSSLRKDIDENLKRVYENALKEDVPDRFKLLLEQLKAKESGK